MIPTRQSGKGEEAADAAGVDHGHDLSSPEPVPKHSLSFRSGAEKPLGIVRRDFEIFFVAHTPDMHQMLAADSALAEKKIEGS